ncbi:MAG TPA: HAD family phosphatase [Thermoanaerobaculia bacterium]|nr:HAD family phosphatase [Thermoanaerobaculia bacterium]
MTFPPRNIEAVIFDFDETMIDLEPQHTAAHARLCSAMGSDYGNMPEEFRRGSGRRVIDDVRQMGTFFRWTRGIDDLFAQRQRYFDEEIASSAGLELMPGVERIVRELHARGFILAITTSAVRSSIETILGRFDLFDRFALIVDGSEVTRGKPDPEAYLLTAGRLGIEPARCVVFEDSAAGVGAAKRAGMFCIAVRNPRAYVFQDLTPADILVSSFDHVEIGWFAG